MSRRLTLTAAGLLLGLGATAGAVLAGHAVAPAAPVHATIVDSSTGLPAAAPSAGDTGTASSATTAGPAGVPAPVAPPAPMTEAAPVPTSTTSTTSAAAPPAATGWSCTADGNTCTQHVAAPAGVAAPVAPPAAAPAPVAPVAPGLGQVPPQH